MAALLTTVANIVGHNSSAAFSPYENLLLHRNITQLYIWQTHVPHHAVNNHRLQYVKTRQQTPSLHLNDEKERSGSHDVDKEIEKREKETDPLAIVNI